MALNDQITLFLRLLLELIPLIIKWWFLSDEQKKTIIFTMKTNGEDKEE